MMDSKLKSVDKRVVRTAECRCVYVLDVIQVLRCILFASLYRENDLFDLHIWGT
jgi:hypothetical protein